MFLCLWKWEGEARRSLGFPFAVSFLLCSRCSSWHSEIPTVVETNGVPSLQSPCLSPLTGVCWRLAVTSGLLVKLWWLMQTANMNFELLRCSTTHVLAGCHPSTLPKRLGHLSTPRELFLKHRALWLVTDSDTFQNPKTASWYLIQMWCWGPFRR